MGKTALKTGLGFKACDEVYSRGGSPLDPLKSALANGTMDPKTVEVATKFYEGYATGHVECWDLDQWNFPEAGTPINRASGQWTNLHFLRHSGTQALIDDLNLFRIAIGACKISIYGTSYGTSIAAAFSSVFPEYSDKIVIDSPQPPLQDAPTWSYASGETTQINEDYNTYVCEKRGGKCVASCECQDEKDTKGDGTCAGDRYLMKDGKRLCTELYDDAELTDLCGDNGLCKLRWKNVCPLCDKGPVRSARRRLQGLNSPGKCFSSAKFDPSKAKPYFGVDSNPYYKDANLACFYNTVTSGGGSFDIWTGPLDTAMVNAQDQQNHVFGITQQLFDLDRAVTGLASEKAVSSFLAVSAGYYKFPPSAPLATAGNPNAHGIIAAQLFDPATAYKWAQEMKGQFPSMALITSPETAHGYRSQNKDSGFQTECQSNIDKYLLGAGFDGQPEDGLFCYTPERRTSL